MLWLCWAVLISCLPQVDTDYLIISNHTLSFYTDDARLVIADNTTEVVAYRHPNIYYTVRLDNVDTIEQFNVLTEDRAIVATNLLDVGGLALLHPTLYILEMGNVNIDPVPRVTAVSLMTGKQMTVKTLDREHYPRALYFHPDNSTLYYSIDTGAVKQLDLATLTISTVTSQYDVWATGLYVQEQVLYIYNSRVLIAHNMDTHETLFTKDVTSWGVITLTGISLKLVQKVEWLTSSTLALTSRNHTTSIYADSEVLDALVLVTNITTTRDSAGCEGCDVCLAGGSDWGMVCGCGYGQNGSGACKTVPDQFVVFTQAQSVSLLSLPDRTVRRLHVNTNRWNMMDVAYDRTTGTVFWVEALLLSNMEAKQSRIMRMDVNDNSNRVVVHTAENHHIDSISINSEDGMLYWLAAKASLIQAARVTCTVSTCVKATLVNTDIDDYTSLLEVAGDTGYMVYVTGEHEIVRRELDGGNPSMIFPSNLIEISSITVHSDTVYIASALDLQIVRMPLLGAGGMRSLVYRALKQFNPINLVFSGQQLVVLNDVERSVTLVNTTTHTGVVLLSSMVGLKSAASNDAKQTSECSTGNGGCQHLCYTRPNGKGFRCGCADGHRLLPDRRTCQAPPVLYISMGGWIQRLHPFSTSSNRTVDNIAHDVGANIVAVDYFWDKEYLVWIDGKLGRITKTSLKTDEYPTERHTDIVIDGLFKPTDISVDWISSTIYWSDEQADSIGFVTLDGTIRKTIVHHAITPTSLVVNPILGLLYWIGWEPDTAVIRSSFMDGSKVSTIISRLSTWPTDITVDYETNRLVWVDAKHSLVASAEPDGTDVQYIVGTHFMQYPISLSVWHNHVYWVDKHMSAVYVADGSNANDVYPVANKLHQVTDMVLAHPEKQAGENACSARKGGCSHLCVPSSATSRVCMCPKRMGLEKDGSTCRILPQELIGAQFKPCKNTVDPATCRPCNPYLLSVGNEPVRLSHQQLSNAEKIAVHYTHQAIYWLDNDKDAIEMVHVNGTGYKTVYKGTYAATDIQLDWLGGNIYWTEADSRHVKCATLNGKYDMIIAVAEPGAVPMFVLLDPPRSKLFWLACRKNGGTLYHSNLAGSVVTAVLNTTACPNSMDIARQTSSIYWLIGNTLHQYRYDLERSIPGRTLPPNTTGAIWVEENLFIVSSVLQGVLTSIDRTTHVQIDVGNSTTFAAYSPLDSGYSGCSVDNGGCTHFCFHETSGVECGCPAQQELLPDSRTCTSPRSQCLDGEWRCFSGECFSESVVCDSHPDCIDQSDEADCGWCKSYEFSCGMPSSSAYPQCIPSSAVCDGVIDCEAGEDEDNSICSPCNLSGYLCKNTGLCLPKSMKCNGVKECLQGDDEKRCPTKRVECNLNEWQCKDGSCIWNTWVCDGDADCDQGDDEQGCPACRDTEFDCEDKQCISLNEQCDGVIQCIKSSKDEMDCSKCRSGERECADGQCRAANRWCDHVPDCSDRSDERACNYTIVQTPRYRQTHVTPTLVIILGSLLMSLFVICILYKYNILPRIRSSYKQLARSSNKTVETNVCVTTNTYSEIETTLCSSDGVWHAARNRSLDPYETMTTSSVSSMLKPINCTQCNPYERLGILPIQSTTDVSVNDGPAPSVVSGGYSSGPGASSHAPSARSRTAGSARSRATSARSRAPMSYHVNNIWDDNINSVSDYDQSCLSDNYLSEYGFPSARYDSKKDSRPCGTPITTDNEEEEEEE